MTPFDLPFGLDLRAVMLGRRWHQLRRRVKLTVHRADLLGPGVATASSSHQVRTDSFFITVTNASRERDIVVTHIWLETSPPVHVYDPALPVRLKHSAPWETSLHVSDVPAAEVERVPWLARCLLAPDDKVVKSQPRKNVPPFGTIPRG
jgi:hypothetical protein